MKTIELNDQQVDFLKDLLKEINSDDISGTAKVIIYQLIEKLNE